MGKIVFICDLEEGHLLPTFGLAHSLKQRGHDISFLSILDNEELITEQGFAFHSTLECLYPKGFKHAFKKRNLLLNKEQIAENLQIRKKHIKHVLDGAYNNFINAMKADLYIIVAFLPFDIFILYYKYNIRPVILNPSIRDPDKSLARQCLDFVTDLTPEEKFMLLEYLAQLDMNFASFRQMFEPLDKLPELIACPCELEIERTLTCANITYIEPSIRKGTTGIDVYKTYNIPANKKIIYASMGSQAIRHGAFGDLFFNTVINAMKNPDFRHLHLILCVGPEYDKNNLTAIPDNVTVLSWGPQIDILQLASVAIIHGGLGGVKECIYYGVPMIVLPQAYDQPLNAKRVTHHGLGFTDNIQTLSESNLSSYISEALTNPEIKTSIQKMQNIFHEYEAKGAGADIIEGIMANV